MLRTGLMNKNITIKGVFMPPHILPKGLRANTYEYFTVMKDVVKPWVDQITGCCHFVFQQDGMPAQNSAHTQEWLKERCGRRRFGRCPPLTAILWTRL